MNHTALDTAIRWRDGRVVGSNPPSYGDDFTMVHVPYKEIRLVRELAELFLLQRGVAEVLADDLARWTGRPVPVEIEAATKRVRDGRLHP